MWSTSLPLSQTTVPTVPQAWKNFAPVVGFAWTPHILSGVLGADKTVVRGGFRIAYDPAFYNMFLNVATAAPKVNFATLGPIVGGPTTGVPTNGVFGTQVIPFLQPLAAGGDPGFANQVQVPQNFRNPYTEQWNLGIQYSFTPRIVGEVRYVGNHAIAQFQELNGNPALAPLVSAGFGNVIPAGLTPCSDPSAPGFGGGYANCNFTNVIKYANTAQSNYNGLQSELRIANWRGLSATASYTYSKTIDNTSEVFSTLGGGNTLGYAQNPFDTSASERANSGIDFPHVVGVAVVYDLPFYKAQHGLLGHVLGGWQVNTTYRYTSGQPYTTIQLYANGSLCDPMGNFGGNYDACRPIVANAAAPLATVGQYNCTGTTASTCSLTDFVTGLPTTANAVHWIQNNPAAAIVYGTPFAGVGRNTLRGQDISTANLAFFKNIKISEKWTAQFQAQAFNVMNTQFRGVPDPILDRRDPRQLPEHGLQQQWWPDFCRQHHYRRHRAASSAVWVETDFLITKCRDHKILNHGRLTQAGHFLAPEHWAPPRCSGTLLNPLVSTTPSLGPLTNLFQGVAYEDRARLIGSGDLYFHGDIPQAECSPQNRKHK